MSRGADPNDAKRKAREVISVGELVDLYFAEGCGTKKPSTIKVERGLAVRHVKPLLGRRSVKSLTRADLETFLADIASGKTATDVKTKARGRAIVTGGQGTANRTVDLVASMLSFAVARGFRDDNPARGLRKFKLKVRERFLSPRELTNLGAAMKEATAKGENPYAIDAIRLLILTGCRKSEILTLQWQWVDEDHRVLRLPDSKTGSKVVPLGSSALELLKTLPRLKDNKYVFPSSTGSGHLVGIQKIWNRVRINADLADVRLHDLRHSFASVGASSGDSLYVIGRLLGHTQQRTTQRYAHLADDPVREAAERISGQIADALIGNEVSINPAGTPASQ